MKSRTKIAQTRIDRYLVEQGIGSRKEVKKLIKSGRVTIDQTVVTDPGTRICIHQVISVDGTTLERRPPLLVWHKPRAIQSTYGDPWGRRSLTDILPPEITKIYHPVGRLDADTTGLLLFSSQGQFTQKLLHPKNEIPRTYVAKTMPAPTQSQLEELALGVTTSVGVFNAMGVHPIDGGVCLTVCEGKHRMVRRMLANVGCPCTDLHRVRYGPFELKDLEEGSFRPATMDELSAARNLGLEWTA